MAGQNHFLQTFGWALLYSLWQMAILWMVYRLLTTIFPRLKSSQKSVLAHTLIVVGFSWFVITFLQLFFHITPVGNFYSPSPDINNLLQNAIPYAAVVYLILLIIPVSQFIKNLRYVNAIRKNGLTKPDAALRLFVNKIAAQMGIKKPVKLWFSEWVATPVTVGFLKPIILLPIAAVNQLSSQQVEAILLHELAHIRRHDYLMNLIIRMIRTVLYFNPFVKALCREIEKERETHCDEMVLQFQYNAIDYAAALLSLEKQAHSYYIMAMNATGNNFHLLNRVEMILGKQKKKSFTFKNWAGLLALLFFILSIANLFPGISKKDNTIILSNNLTASAFPSLVSTTETVDKATPLAKLGPVKTELPKSLTTEKTVINEPVIAMRPVSGNGYMAVKFAEPIAIPELKEYQEAKIQDVLAKSKAVLKNLEWETIERQIADAMTEQEKAELKQEWNDEFNRLNWEQISNNLRLSYSYLDWNSINDQLNSAINQIKADSIQKVVNEAIIALNANKKQIEENVQKAVDAKLKAKAIEAKIANLKNLSSNLKAIKGKKIVKL